MGHKLQADLRSGIYAASALPHWLLPETMSRATPRGEAARPGGQLLARDSCQIRLLRIVTPTLRSEICVKTGPLPALRKRRPVASEKLFTSHHSENGITQSSSGARSRARLRCTCSNGIMAAPSESGAFSLADRNSVN